MKIRYLFAAWVVLMLVMPHEAHAMSLEKLGEPSDRVEVIPKQYLEDCVQGAFEGHPAVYCRYVPLPNNEGRKLTFFCAYKNNNPLGVVCYPDTDSH